MASLTDGQQYNEGALYSQWSHVLKCSSGCVVLSDWSMRSQLLAV